MKFSIRTALALITGRQLQHAAAAPSPQIHAAAVAQYMEGQASSLRNAWDAAAQFGHPETDAEAAMLQAGAAAAQCMSDLLVAAVTGDKERFKESFNAFVNDAISSGVVTV